MSNSLAKLEGAARALAEAKTLDDVKYIRDISMAAAEYARAAKLGLKAQNHAAEVKLKAERKAGEILAGLEREQGQRTDLTSSQPVTKCSEYRRTLDDAEINRMTANRWQTIATLPEEKFHSYIEETKDTGGEITSAAALRLAKGAHVSNNSGNNEWYTPPEYLEAARLVLGDIDLDPASSDLANKTVKAKTHYTEDVNGLSREWHGRVWMNPPYAQPAITNFCKKLASEIDAETVTEAITLTNNATETEWFRELSTRCTVVCFPAGRIKFVDIDGNRSGAPLQGQAIMYFGSKLMEFYDAFSKFGMVFYA